MFIDSPGTGDPRLLADEPDGPEFEPEGGAFPPPPPPGCIQPCDI